MNLDYVYVQHVFSFFYMQYIYIYYITAQPVNITGYTFYYRSPGYHSCHLSTSVYSLFYIIFYIIFLCY